MSRRAKERGFHERVVEAEDDAGWRTVSGHTGQRETGWARHRSGLIESDEAYRYNPMAFRIVELTVDFVLGRGLSLRSEDATVQAWLDGWWNADGNRWATRQFDLLRELCLTGELFVTLHPGGEWPLVRAVSSLTIDDVETSAEDLEDELRWHQGATLGVVDGVKTVGGVGGRWWGRDGLGAVMRHYAVNRLVGTVRGQGDLVVLLPWLRRYRDWLTDRVRLNKYRQAFLFDVTLKGADRRAIVARQTELAEPPPPGSIVVHNEGEIWAAVQPGIDAPDAEGDGLALRLMIAAGGGVPLHYLGEAQAANLATATAMESPTVKRLERRQLYFGAVVVDVARECAAMAGVDGGSIRVEFETLRSDDLAQIAEAGARMAAAAKLAVDGGWITRMEARELVARFTAQPAEGGAILVDVAALPEIPKVASAGTLPGVESR